MHCGREVLRANQRLLCFFVDTEIKSRLVVIYPACKGEGRRQTMGPVRFFVLVGFGYFVLRAVWELIKRIRESISGDDDEHTG